MLLGLAPLILVVAQATPVPAGAPPAPDKKAAAWARKTLQKMTLGERVGQLVVPGLNGVFTGVPWLAEELKRRLPATAPRGQVKRLEVEPAMGAVRLALAEANGGVQLPSYRT